MQRMFSAFAMIAFALMTATTVRAAQTPVGTVPTAAEARFLILANAERVTHGAHPLAFDESLCEAARQHSQEMASLSYFDHLSPVHGLESPADRWERFNASTPTSYTIGENLFYGSEADVTWGHRSLMASPEHRANILNPAFSKAGVGVYVSRSGEMWVTEMFVEYGNGPLE